MTTTTATTREELVEALANATAGDVITLTADVSGTPSLTIPEGVTLTGEEGSPATITFGAKGIRLTRDNTLANLVISTTDYEEAVYNATDIADAGTLTLSNVTTDGQVNIVATDKLQRVRVEADGVYVRTADVRGRSIQPHGYGVDVLQGGFTLWNQQADEASSFTTTLKNIRIGSPETPVRGSGLFVAGYADREGVATGGLLTADLIETGDVYIDGGIHAGTPDKITGGVFVVSGAKVDKVVNQGTVVTFGQNDMVLDNWGDVKVWEANSEVKSTGPSGIGFVNFGDIDTLRVNAPIVTTGKGARGFNLYDGSLADAHFHSIATTGDGSIGIQISKPMGKLTVDNDVETSGGEGMSLVRGQQITLKAMALSVKDGGDVESITIGGALRTRGDNVTTLELTPKAKVHHLVASAVEALGADSVTEDIQGTIDKREAPTA